MPLSVGQESRSFVGSTQNKTMSGFLLILTALHSVSHASDTVPPSQVEPLLLGLRSPFRPECKPLPSTLSLCHGIGYGHMWIPNLLGHNSLKEAQQQSAAWVPLVSKQCHRDTRKFLCSLFAPVCVPELGGPVSPCRSLCEAVRDGCLPVMRAFGFPWPYMFGCARFPSGAELCIPKTEEQDGQTAGEVRHDTEVVKGSVICDVCCLAAEGETDIKENFCHSPYAFKMRLNSVATIGIDLQLVPTANSRILRWAGGGAEKAKEVGGAMAYSALWLPEGGTCTCPGLDPVETNDNRRLEEVQLDNQLRKREDVGKSAHGPWYLALAQAEEGKLVLTRLVRWTRGDKELKKFIRALLKKPCAEL